MTLHQPKVSIFGAPREFPEAGAHVRVDTRPMRLLLAFFAAVALVVPAAASADSIVYSKGTDVWLARADGSDARRVTSGGGYLSPTQADDGTILAQRGTRFVRLSRSGRTLATFASVLTGIPPTVNAAGPFDPVLSPDGTKFAYWIGMYSSWTDHAHGIEWTRTGPVTIWQDARDGRYLGATHYYEEPSWLPDSSGALLFEETNGLTAQVVAAGVGEDHNHVQQWFRDSQTKPASEEFAKPIGAGEISRGMDRLAVLRGGTHLGNGGLSQGKGNTIALYGVKLPGLPTMECLITDPVGGEYGRPSWSPDGRSLAWSEGNGIWAARIGRDCSGTPRLAIPGGREPDWGPAPVSGGSAHRFRVPRSIKRSALTRRGLRVNVDCPSACRASATAKAGGRTIARAAKRIAGGNGVLVLRPKRPVGSSVSVRLQLRPGGTYARTVRVR